MSRNSPDSQKLRARGSLVKDRGFIELNLLDGKINWANDYILDIVGRDFNELTIFDITPSEFHSIIRNKILSIINERGEGPIIWPVVTKEDKIAWFYVVDLKTINPTHFMEAEKISDTEKSGAAFAFMKVQMKMITDYSILAASQKEFEQFTRQKFDKIDDDIGEIKLIVSAIENSLKSVRSSAMRAADEALAAKQASLELKSETNENFSRFIEAHSRHSQEILDLMKTDEIHDQRIDTFENHVKNVTSKAIESINAKATEAGNSLSTRITIPVSLLFVLVALIQFLITKCSG